MIAMAATITWILISIFRGAWVVVDFNKEAVKEEILIFLQNRNFWQKQASF